ncbi:MAG: cytochrome c biogenesis protein CcdA [Acidobacteriota bacterium]|nr:cytochrome c biogenesis protein CcdA [Acidobacteriota bacterium]
MKKAALAIALLIPLFLAAVPLRAQNDAPIVKATVLPPAVPLKAGQTAALSLEISIRAPFHINSDQPSEAYLIGTMVDFKPRQGATFGKLVFPIPQNKKFSFSDNPLSIFEGTFKVPFEVTLAADFAGPELLIEGSVGYQACDDASCQPPTDAAFKATVPVAGGVPAAVKPPAVKTEAGLAGSAKTEPVGKPEHQTAEKPAEKPGDPAASVTQTSVNTAKPDTEQVHPAGASETPAVEPRNDTPAPKSAGGTDFGKKGLLLMFLLVFLGGLALNLTPCIYPLIPITISYFGGQAEGKKGGVVLHSLIYVLGMAMTYSILGVVAAFTGSLFGAALTYPPVLIAIAAVMILLALSMFDVYEFRMPAFLNKAAGTSKKGLGGSFFMGLTVGIIAAPCIGPFVLGLLTYVGDKGNVLLGFSLFFVLAMGLGVPFLLLGIFSGSINKIPRSGAWMVWVRKIFGFILVGMSFYFIKTLLPNALTYNLAMALIALVAGVYLAWIEPTKGTGKAFPFIRNVFGVIFFALALIFAVNGVRGYADEQMNTRLQALAAAGGQIKLDTIAWVPYSEEALADALKSGKPVFIDSTADWCIACHELDKKTYSQPEIIAEADSFVMLRADLTRNDDEKVKAFYKKFAAKGCPTLIWLKPDGAEIAELRGVGFEDKNIFLGKMKKALAAK